MFSFLRRWLKVQPEELGVFLWSAALLFMIRTSGVILNNFAETTFLKRFGVEYLPVVYAINAVATFMVMGMLTGIMMRLTSARLLAWMLWFCGISIALLRLVVGADFTPVYPVLFLLKAQYEALLALVFWNLANDLFNTRQSKRLFPLITIGGVVGGIIGSFGTPWLVKAVNLDNLMLVYLVTTAVGGFMVMRMDTLFPTLDLTERKATKVKRKTNIKEEIKRVIPLLKESTLMQILVVITFVPNVLIPILNYQFNFAVNQSFATEGGMVDFFSYFRGSLNIISLVILLFVGKIYTRWGLPVALMFHPVNYVIAFLALFFRFNVYSAMYARITTNVLRDTINNPARNILMGILPDSSRALLRPFLRGTVVRIAILLGSGIILLVDGIWDPSYISLVAVGFGLVWVAADIWLKRAYSGILLDAISGSVVDFRGLEDQDLDHLFKEKGAQNQLITACRQSDGAACVWYAEMAKAQGVAELDPVILELLPQRDSKTVALLLELISPQSGRMALDTFGKLLERGDAELSASVARAAARLMPMEEARTFLRGLLDAGGDARVQAQAVVGLYRDDPERYDAYIERWLASPDLEVRCAGVDAAGGSGNQSYIPRLEQALAAEKDPIPCQHLLSALLALGAPNLVDLAQARLESDPASVPLGVIAGLPVDDERTVCDLVRLLGDEDPEYRELAQKRLREVPDERLHLLIESLALPGRRLREGLLELLDTLNISDRDIIAFVREQLVRAYRALAEAAAVAKMPESDARDLLINHLTERKRDRLEIILRVLATQEDSADMRIVQKVLDSSANERMRSNAVEALDALIGRSLSASMLPLLENSELREQLTVGRKEYGIDADRLEAAELVDRLLAEGDWVAQYLGIQAGRAAGVELDGALLAQLTDKVPPPLAALAASLAGKADGAQAGEAGDMDNESTLTERILLLKRMEIFDGLTVAQLAAIASLTKETDVQAGDAIVREGEDGDTMYLVVDGEVAVSTSGSDGCSMELERMGPGTYFGEMALVEDMKRSATVTAVTATRLLSLHKLEFIEAVREYPEVALQMCKELSRRLRHVQQKIRTLPVCFA